MRAYRLRDGPFNGLISLLDHLLRCGYDVMESRHRCCDLLWLEAWRDGSPVCLADPFRVDLLLVVSELAAICAPLDDCHSVGVQSTAIAGAHVPTEISAFGSDDQHRSSSDDFALVVRYHTSGAW